MLAAIVLSALCSAGCDRAPEAPDKKEQTTAEARPSEPAQSEPSAPAQPAPSEATPPESDPVSPQMALMQAICGEGEAQEDGCAKCPEFTRVADRDQRFALDASASAKLTAPDTNDRLVTLTGCARGSVDETTVVVTADEDGWTRLAVLSGADVDDCQLLERGDGRDIAVCVSEVHSREGNVTSILAVTGESDGTVSTENLLAIESRPSQCQRGEYALDSLSGFYARDSDGDGAEELLVDIHRRRGEVPPQFDSTCDEGFEPSRRSDTVAFANEGGRLVRVEQ